MYRSGVEMERDDIKAIKCAVCVMGSKKFVLTIMGRESKCWAGEWFTVSELIESPAPCATARPLRDPSAPPPCRRPPPPPPPAGSRIKNTTVRRAVVAMVARGMNGGGSGRAGGGVRAGGVDGRTPAPTEQAAYGRPCVGQRNDDDTCTPRHTSSIARAHTRAHRTPPPCVVLVYRPRAHCACPARHRRRRLTTTFLRLAAQRRVNKVTVAAVISDVSVTRAPLSTRGFRYRQFFSPPPLQQSLYQSFIRDEQPRDDEPRFNDSFSRRSS